MADAELVMITAGINEKTGPLVLCPVLIVWLPESLSLLALDELKSEQVRALLMRVDPSVTFAADTRFTIVEESGKGFLLP